MQLNASQSTLDRLLTTCTATVGTQLLTNAGLSPDTLTKLAFCDVQTVAGDCAGAIATEQSSRGTVAALPANVTSAAPAPAASGERETAANLLACAAVLAAVVFMA